MAHFKRVTSEPPSPEKINAVIMGRKTWDSIPPRFRPLDGRTNVVLTTQQDFSVPDNVLVARSIEDACRQLSERPDLGHVFVIGGAQIYDECLRKGILNRIVYTEVSHIDESKEFDAFFPELQGEWDCKPFQYDGDSCGDKENERAADAENTNETTIGKDTAEEHVDAKSGLRYKFLEYNRVGVPEGPGVNPEELQYLDLCQDIIDNGVKRGDRTGTGTLSKFGTQMRFSLRDGTLPLLTTKRVFWRGVAEELLWFISVSVFLLVSLVGWHH